MMGQEILESGNLDHLVASIAEALDARGEMLAAAESCTGGLIAAACTERSGSSVWFDRGFVTYSNAAKRDCLEVKEDTLAAHGAVSEAVVHEMCAGALAGSAADWSVAVSGVAGPGGGTPDKPVGTVVIGWQHYGKPASVTTYRFDGGRAAVRYASVFETLAGLNKRVTRPENVR